MRYAMTRFKWECTCAALLAALVLLAAPAAAQSSFPIGAICGDDLCDAPRDVCSASGFKIALIAFSPAPPSATGAASYTYRICSPPPGVCTGTVRPGELCLEHNFCKTKGSDTDPNATCTRECATADFKDLSHVNVMFPPIGASCLPAGTLVTGTCSLGSFTLGDPSCHGVGTGSEDFVAKCELPVGTSLAPGQCLTMTVNIYSEAIGLGDAVVVDKAGPNCTGTCILGPSCECQVPPDGQCLTRTAGFWGTHPQITEQFLPVSVCDVSLSTAAAGSGNSATEALCVAGGVECRSNPAYAQLVRQLTAAKLNLAATLANGGTCGSAIDTLIADCEKLCNANQSTISTSGCIQALEAFNQSVDTLTPTPPPFNNPGPAQPAACQAANGNGIVIGKPAWCK